MSISHNTRKDFPMLSHITSDKPLVYLDNTATTQKPQIVIDTLTRFYQEEYATIHRGVYGLSVQATDMFDAVRNKVKNFIHAKSEKEIVFVKGTTEAINLVAQTFGTQEIKTGQEILISEMEHHANIVPWQEVCKRTGATLKVIPILDNGELDMQTYKLLLSNNTAIVAVTHVSNVLGSINPVKEITELAHKMGAKVLIDGAQAVAHQSVDVHDIGCDFYCFSSHKMYGPTGVGVLYGKYKLLETMPPYQTGGDMIETVTFEKTTFTAPPQRFEAGTPAIAEVMGLGAAIDYILSVGFDNIEAQESLLLETLLAALDKESGIRLIGTSPNKDAIVSFVMDDVHPHDVGTILDTEGVAVRVGHHCAQPLMKRYNVPATIRASLCFYNTTEDIQKFIRGLEKVRQVML